MEGEGCGGCGGRVEGGREGVGVQEGNGWVGRGLYLQVGDVDVVVVVIF